LKENDPCWSGFEFLITLTVSLTSTISITLAVSSLFPRPSRYWLLARVGASLCRRAALSAAFLRYVIKVGSPYELSHPSSMIVRPLGYCCYCCHLLPIKLLPLHTCTIRPADAWLPSSRSPLKKGPEIGRPFGYCHAARAATSPRLLEERAQPRLPRSLECHQRYANSQFYPEEDQCQNIEHA